MVRIMTKAELKLDIYDLFIAPRCPFEFESYQ